MSPEDAAEVARAVRDAVAAELREEMVELARAVRDELLALLAGWRADAAEQAIAAMEERFAAYRTEYKAEAGSLRGMAHRDRERLAESHAAFARTWNDAVAGLQSFVKSMPAPVVNYHAPAAQPAHVVLPEQFLKLTLEQAGAQVNLPPLNVEVRVPEQPAPVVHVAPAAVSVAAPPAAQVTLPEQFLKLTLEQAAPVFRPTINVAPAAVPVTVNLPEQAAPQVTFSPNVRVEPRLVTTVLEAEKKVEYDEQTGRLAAIRTRQEVKSVVDSLPTKED